MLFLFVPQESWDLQLRMFGYVTRGFPRIFGYVLQAIKYSISVFLSTEVVWWMEMLTFLFCVLSFWSLEIRPNYVTKPSDDMQTILYSPSMTGCSAIGGGQGR